MRKFESLFYKIHVCLQKTTTCIGLQAEQKFSVNIYFSILGVTFAVPFLCYFQKLQLFAALYYYIYELKKCLRFLKTLFQTGDINIFVLCGAFFGRYVQLKSSFSGKKKTLTVKSETHFSRKAIEKLAWQSIKGKFDHWQKLELCKVIHSEKLHRKSQWECDFNSRKCVIFLVSLR